MLFALADQKHVYMVATTAKCEIVYLIAFDLNVNVGIVSPNSNLTSGF